ncbi:MULTISPECIES: hypothetical protein [Stenotrophomonas]|uniref:hypothetical protein n=1 Tax=Stenotrophomonas TaxID=40323 RepID=UPI000D54250F|nr:MULTISPECIES: hypothetical protein [Stenotrophomonas]AWH29254.1 hypothetical protein C1931_10200 [Stenotrophomonas sp. YAU14A_MKIMI4_1]AWH33228.1 hypothetical protein C1930_10330 [Stenotrophomonas sp. SAU14A_NAIMI4_8]
MDSKLKGLADRLKSRIDGAATPLVGASDMTDLIDAHLDLVSAAHGSGHTSGHKSGHASAGTGDSEVEIKG